MTQRGSQSTGIEIQPGPRSVGLKHAPKSSGVYHYRKKQMSSDLKLAIRMLLLIRMLPLCLLEQGKSLLSGNHSSF